MIWRFLSVLTRHHVWYFLIVTTIVPFCLEVVSFPAGHNRENVPNQSVNVDVLDVSGGVFGRLASEFGDNALEFTYENGTQPIIFGTLGKPDSSPVRQETTQDCSDKYKNCGLDELHKSLLVFVGLLIGSIIGNYFGALYSLRYRSNSAAHREPGLSAIRWSRLLGSGTVIYVPIQLNSHSLSL